MVGFVIGLVATPVLIVVDPALVPVGMLVVSCVMPWTTLAQEWRHIDWGGLRWSLFGRFVGTVGGVALVAVLSSDGLGIAVAVMIAVSVVASVSGLHVAVTKPRLLAAGVLGGVGGTATSIGGPPLAVVYANEDAPTIRATLAAFFAVGQLVSLLALLGTGVADPRAAWTGALLLPAIPLGAYLARRWRHHVDAGRTRPAVLVVASVSAVALVVRALL
jgi:uncharacterized membrane protein YfcA